MSMSSDMNTMGIGFVRTEQAPTLSPPASTVGIIGWARANLFSGPVNTLLTLVGILIIYIIVPPVWNFFIANAITVGKDRTECLVEVPGACYPYLVARFQQFIYGFYPEAERWRVNLTALLCFGSVAWLLIPATPRKSWMAAFFFVAFPVLAYILLSGAFGLPKVATSLWGGMLVTFVISIVGIVVSLPLGILLALGRRSKLPLVKLFSVIFIEFWRGVPLITVLFMAKTMLPLFVPEHLAPDQLLRALIGVALFSAAYMAEVVRGGLQAMPKGQYEGADALGLSYPQKLIFIILPQALQIVIPGIVNTFIGLFKDTSLVTIVGIFDFLASIQSSLTDPVWATPWTAFTGYGFAALFYFVFCFGMSRYSKFMEERLARSHKR